MLGLSPWRSNSSRVSAAHRARSWFIPSGSGGNRLEIIFAIDMYLLSAERILSLLVQVRTGEEVQLLFIAVLAPAQQLHRWPIPKGEPWILDSKAKT
jgi:hypothetical protein